MAGYTPQTHYTCAICLRKRLRKHKQDGKCLCADTSECISKISPEKLLAKRPSRVQTFP